VTPRSPQTAAVDDRPPRRRDREVLDTAARVFYEHGYSNASVQDVAEALGILKGSLYHYINTKEDLLFRLLDETHDGVHQILEDVDAIADLGPLEKLRLYVRRQIEFNMDNLVRVSVYYRELDRLSPERRRELLARRREHERFVIACIRDAQAAGRVAPELDAEGVSRCIFATIIWTYRWYSPTRDDRGHVAETCAAFAVNGLAPTDGT
jgi:TetR/AcrR family transcriptional regulator, cholesterol catabolism regulator